MAAVTVKVINGSGATVLEQAGYDPTQHGMKFPAQDIPQGQLPASAGPYKATCTPATYAESGQDTWDDGSVKRFKMTEP